MVHSDIVVKMDLSYPDSYRYYCSFIIDHSRYTFIAFLRKKSDAGSAFRSVTKTIENRSSQILGSFKNKEAMILYTDGTKEYRKIGKSSNRTVENSTSLPNTPDLNGIAERSNRTLMEATRSLLCQANLPRCLWPFALKHAVLIRSRLPHMAATTTPFESFYNERPNFKHVRVFGCTAYVLALSKSSKKDYRASEGVI